MNRRPEIAMRQRSGIMPMSMTVGRKLKITHSMFGRYAYLYIYNDRWRVRGSKLPGCAWTLVRRDGLTYAGAMDFRDGADVSVEYSYDANGNMTSDLNKGINLIRYNVLNLPGYVQFADGHSVTYTYDADGNKLRTVSGVSGVSVLPGAEGSPITPATLDDVGQIEGPVTVLSTREYCGGHVYMDGRLERTLQPWGYTGADGTDYFYITDYLGNVRTVTDRDGYACELNAYYPYGALMNTLSGNGTRQPYKYGGKELDRTAGLDLYDSQARFYDPVLGRTTTVDPKSAAYAGTSHYSWCAGNPTRYVDPDGRDEWEINSEGQIVGYKKTKEHDSFYLVNENNQRIENSSIVLPYNTVIKSYSKYDNDGVKYDTFVLRGDQKATELFEFFAKNTKVEWSQAQVGIEGKNGLNFVTSSHQEGREGGASDLIENQLQYNYNVRTINHSHPNNAAFPSGLDGKGGDIPFANWVTKLLGKTPAMNIFVPEGNYYVPFNPKSKKEDYELDRSSISLNLGEFQFIGK